MYSLGLIPLLINYAKIEVLDLQIVMYSQCSCTRRTTADASWMSPSNAGSRGITTITLNLWPISWAVIIRSTRACATLLLTLPPAVEDIKN